MPIPSLSIYSSHSGEIHTYIEITLITLKRGDFNYLQMLYFIEKGGGCEECKALKESGVRSK